MDIVIGFVTSDAQTAITRYDGLSRLLAECGAFASLGFVAVMSDFLRLVRLWMIGLWYWVVGEGHTATFNASSICFHSSSVFTWFLRYLISRPNTVPAKVFKSPHCILSCSRNL